MISVLKRGVLLAGVGVLFASGVGQVQVTAVVAPDSSLHDLTTMSPEPRLADLENSLSKNFDRSDTSNIGYNMPIYNPGNNAAIMVYRPPDDLIYNMPIIGKRPEREEKKIDLWFYPENLFGKEKE